MKLIIESWRRFADGTIDTYNSTVYGHKVEDLLRNLKRGEGIYEDEGLEMIEFQKDYLEGMSKKPSVELYRAVFAKSIDDVDRSNLGHHYTDDYDSFTLQMMESLLSQARQENPSLELEDARIIKVSAPTNAIDYEEVMRTWSLFPYEYEITLSDTSGVEILDVDDAYESNGR